VPWVPILPTTRHRNPRLPKPNRRRALELLASCPEGCTEAIMLAHGFSVEMIIDLICAGLARAHAERVVPDDRGRARANHGGGALRAGGCLKMTGRDYLAFGDIEGKLDMLRIECTRCPRAGRYSVPS